MTSDHIEKLNMKHFRYICNLGSLNREHDAASEAHIETQ